MMGLHWSELALVAVAALLILGPKDLPHIMRHIGFLVRKARSAITGFQEELESISYQQEIKKLKEEVNLLRKESSIDIENNDPKA
jgi:sec-independent protein translocase protein TatB